MARGVVLAAGRSRSVHLICSCRQCADLSPEVLRKLAGLLICPSCAPMLVFHQRSAQERLQLVFAELLVDLCGPSREVWNEPSKYNVQSEERTYFHMSRWVLMLPERVEG